MCTFPDVRRLRQRVRRAGQARNGMTSRPESNGRPRSQRFADSRATAYVASIRRSRIQGRMVRGAHLRRLMPRDNDSRTHARIDLVSTGDGIHRRSRRAIIPRDDGRRAFSM